MPYKKILPYSIGCSNISNAQMLAVSMQLQGTRTPSIIVENEENDDFWKVIQRRSNFLCSREAESDSYVFFP
jgi:hypothetical protein